MHGGVFATGSDKRMQLLVMVLFRSKPNICYILQLFAQNCCQQLLHMIAETPALNSTANPSIQRYSRV
jgi:hypothetical protein